MPRSYVCLPETPSSRRRASTRAARRPSTATPFDVLGGPPDGHSSRSSTRTTRRMPAGSTPAQFPTVTASGHLHARARTSRARERTAARAEHPARHSPARPSRSSTGSRSASTPGWASPRLPGLHGHAGRLDPPRRRRGRRRRRLRHAASRHDARDDPVDAPTTRSRTRATARCCPGRTFTDPEYGISITTVSAGASGLTVQVTVPAQTVRARARRPSARSLADAITGARRPDEQLHA